MYPPMTNRENKGTESASGWLMSQGARKLTQYPRLQARPQTVDHTLLRQHLQFHFLLEIYLSTKVIRRL